VITFTTDAAEESGLTRTFESPARTFELNA
jgi:hypothetical protein